MTDSMQQMALDTLGAYFGYTSFRPGQDRMVDAILAGRDALGVMPTGAGKSICYQVPALMLLGITFVVSPLLSLMEDQTRALLAAGARPSYLNSSLTPAQQNTVLKRAREGRYQLMYVAPERLLEPRFLAFAREAAADGGIGVPLVAIDEAHCVSQWGQDFRPAYLQIREFIDSLPQRPIVAAFTATATERVRADIQQMLGLQNPATVVTGFDRKNLYFGCEEMGDKAKAAWVRDYVIAHSSESGIVYCSTRKTVDALAGELAEALGPSGIHVGRYHAGMGNEARRQSQRCPGSLFRTLDQRPEQQVGQRVEPSVHRNHARVDHARVGRVDADASRRSPGQLEREQQQRQLRRGAELPRFDGADRVARDTNHVGQLRLRQPLCRPHLPQAIAQRQALVFLPHTPRTTLTTYAASAAAAAIVVSMANTRSDFFRVKAKRG